MHNKTQLKVFILFLFIALISGCSSPVTEAPLPTLEIIRVGVSPAVKIWQSELQTCAQSLPGVALMLIEKPTFLDIEDRSSIEFFLQLGGTNPPSTFGTQVGSENIVWITNPNNPIQQITFQQLSNLYQENAVNFPGISDSQASSIEIWLYPQGNALTEYLFSQINISKPILSKAFVAPDPEAMLQAVSENQNALGFVPQSWIKDDPIRAAVHQISITDPGPPKLQILALAAKEPQSTGRQLLLCLVDSLKAGP